MNAKNTKQIWHALAPIDPDASVTANMRAIKHAGRTKTVDLALKTGLNRMTIASAEGSADPRLSTVVTMLDAMGYGLLPVPQPLMRETANFINNGGKVLSLPAGVNAPLGLAQQLLQRASAAKNATLPAQHAANAKKR